ncbi:MAG: hypothetical protein ACRD3Q_01045 [Terriglobales bacterium]
MKQRKSNSEDERQLRRLSFYRGMPREMMRTLLRRRQESNPELPLLRKGVDDGRKS